MAKQAVELKKDKYTIQVNYSKKARDNKLMRFITPSGDSFEISAEEMASILVGQVNTEVLGATFVESEQINVVEVTRQLSVQADRDISKGEIIRLEYRHPYPIEFAVIEEAMKYAKINRDVECFKLTPEYIRDVRKKTKKEQKTFIKKFYQFFNTLRKKE